jgi:hypothetical protein
VPARQVNPAHRTGGRPARRAQVELRLQFDTTAEPSPVQADPALSARPARPEQTVSRGRLSLVVS